ncbi:MAG: hypothetical protein VKP62_08635 [Candidatus Sericytochromatia bacterium]|nr:hypothetical protein [Candidatus Sericytochromatia bacterium]
MNSAQGHLKLAIAGFAIELDLPDPAWWPPLLPRLGAFLCDRPADARLTVALTLTGELPEVGEPLIFQDDAGTHLCHDQYHGTLSSDGSAKLRVLDPSSQSASPDAIFPMAIDGLLRLQISQLLTQQGGVMMHAAGIAGPNACGSVFFGPSGSGKTTLCGLSSARYDVLCDELVAVRLDGPEPELHSTPFFGAWGSSLPGTRPLAALYRLRKATQHRVSPLTPPAAIREILESTVYYDQSPKGLARSLEIAQRLVEQVPVRELHFALEESVWDTITQQV